MALALALGRIQPGGQSGKREAELLQQLALRRLGSPEVGAVGSSGVDNGIHRLRRQFHLRFHPGELLIKLRNPRRGLLLLTGNRAELGQQRLPAFIVVIDDKGRGDGGELIVERDGGIAPGGANEDQIRHLGGHRFCARLADVKPGQLTLFRDITPLTQETLIVRHPVVRGGGTAGDHRGVNGQQGAGEGHAGGDNPRRFALKGVRSAAVRHLTRPVGGDG